jgi:hypothetical protein
MFTGSKWNWFTHGHSPFFINSGALEKQTRRVAVSVEMGFNPSVACGRVIRSSLGAVENHIGHDASSILMTRRRCCDCNQPLIRRIAALLRSFISARPPLRTG